jgi:SAM-dependent methyltransferase
LVRSPVRPAAIDTRLWQQWPGRAIREPSLTDSHYLHQKRLALTLASAVERTLTMGGEYRILDVGSGRKPYFPIFEPYAREYIGIDASMYVASEIRATAEQLPLREQSIDVIVSTQVLEHVSDPAATVTEWRRTLSPGGVVFASTHGMYLYHPVPNDHWRWTHTGLRKLFEGNGFRVRSVEACERTLSVLTMLASIHAATFADRHRLGWLFRPALAGLNALVDRIDRVSTGAAVPDTQLRWGAMPCSYLVVAERPANDPAQDGAATPFTTCRPSARVPTLV